MPAPKNTFKANLKSGTVQIGVWAGMADAYATEMVGTAGFDWVLIDGEHAPNDMRSILGQLQAIEASPSNAVVRLPVGNEALVKQALDLGVQTLLIPMVESAAQARDMVSASTYPPHGRRGVGAALARASRFSEIKDYVTTAGAEIALLLQVENVAGMNALDDILTVEGVDGVFIGPADLAADMGFPGQTAHPEVRAKVLEAIGKIHAAGRAAGILSTDDEFTQQCIDLGVEFTAVGIDVVQFVSALRGLATKFKQG